MTKPPLNQLIKWDGSETPPVPVGTEVTCWFSDTPPISGLSRPDHSEVDPEDSWYGVTAYMVHAYPPEDEVALVDEVAAALDLALNCIFQLYSFTTHAKPEVDPGDAIKAANTALLRYRRAEIVSQEKA